MRVLAVLCLLAAAWSETAGAGREVEPRIHRLVRYYDWARGYPWSYTAGVEQDARGFLWVAATSGLYRFDGSRAVRYADPLLLAPGGTAAGRVLAYGEPGTFEVTPEGLVPLDDGGTAPGAVSMLMVASDGTPWRVRDAVVERLDEGRGWSAVAVDATEADPIRRVHPGRDGRVYVSSLSQVWVVEPAGVARRLAAIERALVLVERADGTVVAGANQDPGPVTTRLFEIDGASARAVFEERGSRLLSIVERQGAIWVSMDSGVQGLGEGWVPRDRVDYPSIPTGGHLIVDRESSLWMASSSGLAQIPEPDVYGIAPLHGMVTRDLARTDRGVWGTFWGVLAFFSDEAGALHMTAAGEHFAALCPDGAGRTWTVGLGALLRLDGDGTIRKFSEEHDKFDPHGCGEGADGRRWIASMGRHLWTVAPSEERPRHVPIDLDLGQDGLSFAAEAGDGTLWLATGSRMCSAPAAELLAGRPVEWRCETMPDGHDVIDLQSMPSGDVWALTRDSASIRRRADGRWEPLPGRDQLGSNFPTSMAPSPSGGVWVTGQGLLMRLGERLDRPAGMEILEQPTVWNGMITLNVMALEEDPDGTLWLATDAGIEKIPAAIRNRRADPPAVELVEGSVNGVPLDAQQPVRLPPLENRLVLHFAALTYRDPAAVRFRMRLGEDDEWSAPSAESQFTFVDLPPGRYALEVAATLDGERWSSTPARLEFDVRLPWYGEPWWIGGMTLGAVAAFHVGYRLRLRRRLVRERQRTRIAMDLHDEVGSGLGTIAVLAGIAGRPELPPERREDVASRIAAVSQELARSLGDIVWSLRTSSGSLDALWNQLLERARPLFASGTPRITFEAPDPIPDEALSLVVRRNLHLVVYEALHNASRHAGASLVTLRLAADGTTWRLEVEDDGRGLPEGQAAQPQPSVRRGLGLEAMKARVAEMGGTIAWERGAAGGTRVSVRFRTGEG